MSRRARGIMIDSVLFTILAWNAAEAAFVGATGWMIICALGAVAAAISLSICVFPAPENRHKIIRPRWKL